MFLDSRNGQPHLSRYFGRRLFLNPAGKKHPPRLGREPLDNILNQPQFVARVQLRLQILVGLEQLQIRYGLEGDDLGPAGLVDHQVAGDGEEKGAPGGDPLPVRHRIGPHEHFGHQVLQLFRRRLQLAQPRAQRGLMRQDNRLVPVKLCPYRMHPKPPTPLAGTPVLP